jgi:hypothetical protein
VAKAAVPASQELRRWWPVDEDRIQEEMDRCFGLYGKELPTQLLYEWQTQHKGGVCMVEGCGRPFRRQLVYHALYALDEEGKPTKEVRQVFADFYIYVPDCHCYKTCKTAGRMISIYTRDGPKEVMWKLPGCGRVMVAERLTGDKTCMKCGGIIL